MDLALCFTSFIICIITIFIVVYISYTTSRKKPINKIHFYVARDKNGELWLYIGKPIRGTNMFSSPLSNLFILPCNIFNHLGLNKKDYGNLKWEDEPVEVFLNMEG